MGWCCCRQSSPTTPTTRCSSPRPGPCAARAAFERILTDLPDATWDVPTQVYEDDVLFIEWPVVATTSRVIDGVDTFVFAGDSIRVQTVRCTLETTG